MKMIVASDSFKGCLSSKEVNQAIEEGIHQFDSSIKVIQKIISDGGEGFIDAISQSISGTLVSVKSVNPLMKECDAQYFISSFHEAYIESASVLGLHLLSHQERNPMNTTSYGLGLLIKDAIDQGCHKIWIGLGGSSTNDGGIGMLSALGWTFYHHDEKMVNLSGKSLRDITSIHRPKTDFIVKITVLSDVDNPLLGDCGATYTYASQKGATLSQIQELEKGMNRFQTLMNQYTGCSFENESGSGAAGGLGYAFKTAFLSPIQSGISYLIDQTSFDDLLSECDILFTGEGRIDFTTFYGKAVGGILQKASQKKLKVVCVTGENTLSETTYKDMGIHQVIEISSSEMSESEKLSPLLTKKRISFFVHHFLFHYIK